MILGRLLSNTSECITTQHETFWFWDKIQLFQPHAHYLTDSNSITKMEHISFMTTADSCRLMDAYIHNIREDPNRFFQVINLIGDHSDTFLPDLPDLPGQFFMDNRNMAAILSVIESSLFSFLKAICINCPIRNDGSIAMLYHSLRRLPSLQTVVIKGAWMTTSAIACDIGTIHCLLSQGPANDMQFTGLQIQSFDMTNRDEAIMVQQLLMQKTNISHLHCWKCNFDEGMDLTWLLSGLQKTSALQCFSITRGRTLRGCPLGDVGATKIIKCLHKCQNKSLKRLQFYDSLLNTQAYLAIACMLTDPDTVLRKIDINEQQYRSYLTNTMSIDNMINAMEFRNSTLDMVHLTVPYSYDASYLVKVERIICRNAILRRLMTQYVPPLPQHLPITCRCWQHYCRVGPSPTYWLLRSCYPHFSVAVAPDKASGVPKKRKYALFSKY
jgi:hypothetical protein